MLDEFRERARRAALAAGSGAIRFMQALSEAYAEYLEQPAPCVGCRQEYPRKVMSRLSDIPAYADCWYLIFCGKCQERLRATYQYEGLRQKENRKLLIQLKRAMDRRLPATLTLDQWLTTLDYHKGLCAYCLVEPYEALEHYIPIELGGGTTAANCVPSCKSCNSAKGARHPADIRESSRSPAAMSRVCEYLKIQRSAFPATEACDEERQDA